MTWHSRTLGSSPTTVCFWGYLQQCNNWQYLACHGKWHSLLQRSLLNSPVGFMENQNSQYRLWTTVCFYCTTAKFSGITSKVCRGSVYFSLLLFPTMSPACICVLCYRMSLWSYPWASQLPRAVWQMQLSKIKLACSGTRQKGHLQFQHKVLCVVSGKKRDSKTKHVGKCSQHKQNVVLLCKHERQFWCVYKMRLWTAQVYWLKLWQICNSMSVQGATWHKMLTARSQISQVLQSMMLCLLTVTDILEELAVSIFNHLPINMASYRGAEPSWWWLFLSVSPRKS